MNNLLKPDMKMENKTSTLNKKLKSYSALAGTLVAAANTANAQVVYTDVIPDATIASGGTYDLDLNNDGTADFQFQLQHGTYTYMSFPIQYDLGVLLPGSGNAIDTINGGANAHAAGVAINNTLAFVDDSSPYQLLGVNIPIVAYSSGNFIGQTDKYLGLRFQIAGVDHYGWARIDMNATATSITVKDYAYDATAGASILTGATSTGISESAVLANAVTVFSNANTINVNMNNAKLEGMITVTNALGQEISKTSVTAAQMSIPMNNVTAGVYFVTVSQGNAKFTKKVMIN